MSGIYCLRFFPRHSRVTRLYKPAMSTNQKTTLLKISTNNSFGNACHDTALDAALILAAKNLKISLVTPVGVPRVGRQPVRHTTFDAPAEDANGVTAQQAALGVLVDARLVRQEVGVDAEGRLHRSILENIGANLFLVSSQTVRILSEVLVLVIAHRVDQVFALATARGRARVATARRAFARAVVLAGRQRVRLAALLAAVESAGDEALLHPVLPRLVRVAAVAAEATTEATTLEQVLRRDGDILVVHNANPIGDGLHAAERPTITTRRLVAYRVNRGALWPLLARVKVVGQGGRVVDDVLEQEFGRRAFAIQHSHQLLHLAQRHIAVKVAPSLVGEEHKR